MTFETARFDLARLRLVGSDSLDAAMARAAEVSARTLGVRRVGVWAFDVEHDAMRCLHLYDDVSGHSSPGTALALSDYAPYVSELERVRTIVADDARTHPATQCLSDSYFRPQGIGATLDAPVYRDGKVVGVVCHEHLGGTRQWSEREVDFACSVADILGTIAEQATHLETVAALREHQKMEALGRLAGGVAHDFQNLLSVVLIHASRIRAHPRDATIALESAGEIREAAEEGALLTKRLQAFAEPRRDQPQHVSLGEIAERMEPILRLMTKRSVRLTLRRETTSDDVFADPSELEEVLLGLVTNVRDALNGGAGEISVTVRAPGPTEGRPGSTCVALEVWGHSTNAFGHAPMVVSPLLNTKFNMGQDGGIGLATVRDVVERAHGAFRVESRSGEAPTFTVLWPLSE